MSDVDAAVIGAGVVGLAVARALSQAGREVVVLERHRVVGDEASSRNSEVIHAGLYYPPGSLRARLCVHGKALLYACCEERAIAHRRCGKLVVITAESERPKLDAIAKTAKANGVDDLRLLSAAEARALEPALHCVGALYSPSTGIIDSHGLMLALRGDLEAAGGVIAFSTEARAVARAKDHLVLGAVSQGVATELSARWVVNCAGLDAPLLAAHFEDMPRDKIPPRHLAKGNYFMLTGKPPFSRLIYPLPDQVSLGMHYTLDLAGHGRFGPDVEWIDAVNYDVHAGRAAAFYASIRHYWPELRDGALYPGYAGIRPKIVGPGEAPRDFMIQGPDDHGVPGVVHLFGIDSPGLTSCLAIGEHVAAMCK